MPTSPDTAAVCIVSLLVAGFFADINILVLAVVGGFLLEHFGDAT